MASRHSIITTGGTDGACCAAVVLVKHGSLTVHVTSQNAVQHALRYKLYEDPKPKVVHVCGVGIAENSADVFEQLDALRETGVQVIWYCGRGYLEEYRSDLEKHCTVVFTGSDSNTAAIATHLKIAISDRLTLLLDLAKEYSLEKEGPKEHRFWHDLVSSASMRYFQLGDEEAFLRVLRKLAGLLSKNKADEEEVALYRRTSRSKQLSLGRSPAMRHLRKRIKLAAVPYEPVLIMGPSGSGKELVARALHDGSPRKAERFYPVNCAILGTSPDLAYDRLFGHVAGAYTGATSAAPGAFEAAGGGTLFLDEVAELPLSVQTQLLRVIEEKTISPMGTVDARPVDVRVLAATNRDLPALVRKGKFRLDLYHRLGVLTIEVPTLKERIEDAVTIAKEVAWEMTVRGHQMELSKNDRVAIVGYDWPGNIRQLTNLVKRAACFKEPLSDIIKQEHRRGAFEYELLSGTSEADTEFVRLFLPRTSDDVRPMQEIRDTFAKRALELFDGNWTRASKALGVSTNTLRSWIVTDHCV